MAWRRCAAASARARPRFSYDEAVDGTCLASWNRCEGRHSHGLGRIRTGYARVRTACRLSVHTAERDDRPRPQIEGVRPSVSSGEMAVGTEREYGRFIHGELPEAASGEVRELAA